MPIRKDTFLKLTDVRTKTSLDVNLNNISDLGVAKIDNIIDQRPQFAWYCD